MKLTTKRLCLRPFNEYDLDDLYAYAKVPGVGERAGWPHHKNIKETEEILQRFIESNEVYAIVYKKTQTVIGSIGLHEDDHHQNVRTLGYVLSKEYWNQGLMTEAASALIDYAFMDLRLDKIKVRHFVENLVSQKIIKKLGFIKVSEGSDYSKQLEKPFDYVAYELRKDAYLSSRNIELSKLDETSRWELFPVVLKPYNPVWESWYESMKKKILHKLSKDIFRISHIGSTAVPGLKAKPIIDILIEIHLTTDLDHFKHEMEALGLHYQEKTMNPKPHMMFKKGYHLFSYEEKMYHIHIRYPHDCDELYFRDLLIHDETLKKAYSDLKESLSIKYAHQRPRYSEAKTSFIQEKTTLAKEIFNNKYNT